MADNNIRIAVILSAVDQMSAVIASSATQAQAKLRALSSQSFKLGAMASAGAAASAAAVLAPVKAFADLEDSGLRLKSVLMRDGGIVPQRMFEQLNQQAIMLGNKLPGTTADFQNLYSTLIQQGTPAQSILNGVGQAAAYLGVQLKMPMDEVATLAARLRNQMGIADKDMLGFMDQISRLNNVGVSATEMQYAFGRSAGAMKLLGVQGLQASKSLGALFAILIRNGATGETAGTNVAKIMSEMLNPAKMKAFNAEAAKANLSFKFFEKGKFLGIENFVAQLGQLQGMGPEKISKILSPLTGGEGMDNQFLASLAGVGANGLNNMTLSLANQATMLAKVNIMLDSLKNRWEAAMGTMTNTMAFFGATLVPTIKRLIVYMEKASIVLQNFMTMYPTATKYIGGTLLVTTALLSVIATFAITIGALTSGWANLMAGFSLFMKLGPLVNGLILSMGQFLLGAGTYVARMGMLFLTRGIPAMVSFTATVWANAAAWLANPATYIILAIIAAAAALIAIGVLVYKNWDKIMSWFSQQWVIMKAQIAGIISIFKIFQDILLGTGKIMMGIFTFDAAQIAAGAKQAAAAVSKVFNGGITLAYNQGYEQSLKGNGFKTATGGGIQKLNPVNKGNVTHVHFSPQVTVNGGATAQDGKLVTQATKSQFDAWMRESRANQQRLSFSNNE